MRDGHPARPGWPVLLLGVLAGAAVPAFLALVRTWGFRVPQDFIERDYLFGVVWSIVLGLSIAAWPVPARDKRPLLVLWGVKCLVTLGFMLLYEYRYGLDAYNYFELSMQPARPSAQRDPALQGGGTEFIAALSWYHNRILPDSYHTLKASYAMVGLIGVYFFYRAAVIVQGENHRLLYLLGLFPSILFWSSILGKDPVVFLGIGLYAYGVIGLVHRARRGYLVPLFAGVAIATAIRLWLGPIMLFPLAVTALRGVRGFFRKLAFISVCVLALLWSASLFAERFALQAVEDVYSMTENISGGGGWGGGSDQQVDLQISSPADMVGFVPVGAFTALFRPLPGEILNPFGMLAGMENFALLVLVVVAVWRAKLARIREPLVLWAVLFIVAWASVYGFVSSQNLGAAVRFKLQVLPILLGLLLYLGRRKSAAPPAASSAVSSGP